MRLIALLAWWDERPSWLAATIASLTRIGVDHLIAVDGAYGTFPDGTARSGVEQAEQIMVSCDAAGIGLTLDRPQTTWYGGEVEKRTHLFRLAETIAEPGVDWIVGIDADEVITAGTRAVKRELAEAPPTMHVAGARLWVRDDLDRPEISAAAMLDDTPNVHGALQDRFWRAMRDMRVEVTHYHYSGELDGVRYQLRGSRGDVAARLGNVPAGELQLSQMVEIEHRDHLRDRHRAASKRDYYYERDQAGLEAIPQR